MNPEVLNSWKEIAAYLGRGVRTVQRWEQELGLPVRRPRGRERSAVIALKEDVDRWLKQTPQHALPVASDKNSAELRTNASLLRERTKLLLQQSLRVKENLSVTLAATAKLRAEQADWIRRRSSNTEVAKVLAQKAKTLAGQIYLGGVNFRNPQPPSANSNQKSAAK